MSRDPQGGGTDADGSRSAMDRSHSDAGGRPTMPDVTPEPMPRRVRDRLREVGIPGAPSWVVTRKLPKAARRAT